MRALIVDNNPTFLSIFDKLLTVKGFDVTSEITFKAGLKHLKNKSYAVIFIDIPLDGYTEKQILSFLTKNNVFKKSNVLLFSSMDLNDLELDEWKKEGLYSYLKKPVERNIIVKTLNNIRAKIKHPSQVLLNTSDAPADEEATPEQLEKLDQLQKQILELESRREEDTQTSDAPADEEDTQTSDAPADEEATPEQLEKLDQLQKQILELESRREEDTQTSDAPADEEDTQTSDAPADEEATPEQLEKLDQLQKQILELEHVLYSLNQKDSSLKQSISVESESVTNDLPFKNIINDLKYLQSRFESSKQHVEEPSVTVNVEKNELIKKKLEKSLSDLSKLKNEIQSSDKSNVLESKSASDSLINKKKSKMTKKSANAKIGKSKMTKKSANAKIGKSKMIKKPSKTKKY